MSTMLTRDQIMSLNDIDIKEITVPEKIPAWGGKSLFIRQLTRGKQDEFLRRQFGTTKMKAGNKTSGQELASMQLFGHDAWLCVQGVCDANGSAMFADTDIALLDKKSGEAIGWIAKQILEFSGMAEDQDVIDGTKTDKQVLADEIKN